MISDKLREQRIGILRRAFFTETAVSLETPYFYSLQIGNIEHRICISHHKPAEGRYCGERREILNVVPAHGKLKSSVFLDCRRIVSLSQR